MLFASLAMALFAALAVKSFVNILPKVSATSFPIRRSAPEPITFPTAPVKPPTTEIIGAPSAAFSSISL